MTAGKHEVAVDEYVKDYDLLSESHPMIVNLKELAIDLDNEFRISAAQQFQMIMRYLESRKLTNEEESDLEEDLLSPNR